MTPDAEPGASRGRWGCWSATHGDRVSALAVATPGLDAWTRGDWQFSIWAAEAYTLIGESDRALAMLESAIPFGLINYPFLTEYNELLRPLWREPREQAFLSRAKHEWKTFQKARRFDPKPN